MALILKFLQVIANYQLMRKRIMHFYSSMINEIYNKQSIALASTTINIAILREFATY